MAFKRFERYKPDRQNQIGIPTILRGQEYRSRLEARWAEFLFQLNIPFKYEHEEMGGYVPDFAVWTYNEKFVQPHHGVPIFIEIKPTIKSREECIKKFRCCRRRLITFIGNPPGEASFVENVRGQPRPMFGYCDMCGVVSFNSTCQCGNDMDSRHEIILQAAARVVELNFSDVSDDFKEFR